MHFVHMTWFSLPNIARSTVQVYTGMWYFVAGDKSIGKKCSFIYTQKVSCSGNFVGSVFGMSH